MPLICSTMITVIDEPYTHEDNSKNIVVRALVHSQKDTPRLALLSNCRIVKENRTEYAIRTTFAVEGRLKQCDFVISKADYYKSRAERQTDGFERVEINLPLTQMLNTNIQPLI